MLNKDIMGLANDKFIKEADPRNAKKKKRQKKFIFAATIAACLLIALNLWLFIPLKGEITYDISKYNDSEYYEVISALNSVVNYKSPRYSNNFEYLFNRVNLKNDVNVDYEPSPSAPDENSSSSGSYEEVTDNQVSGVIEEDLFKRSDKYIYYLSDTMDAISLRIYSIEGEDSKEVASYDILDKNINSSATPHGIYLSNDCKTVTVILSSEYMEISLISIDVSSVNSVKEKTDVKIKGYYVSSRVIDGELFVINTFSVPKGEKFTNQETFIPSLDMGDGTSCIPPEDIVVPGTVNSNSYTVISRFDETTLEKKDCAAFLSYSPNIYVSKDTIYLTHKYYKNNTISTYTDIMGISFADDRFEKLGTVTVEGYVNNQYSLDEYEGNLRVATTTNNTKGTNASLNCIDLDSWKIYATVENFAPYGETVKSVRFDGTNAYVCTSFEAIDPVFFFDLSDYGNITYKETPIIEGFSTSLVNFGDGYLLGIGRGDRSDTFKLEIYTEGSDIVESVCKFEIKNTMFASDYKAYYIDRENQTVGMAIASHNTDTSNYNARYLLLKFDGKQFTEITSVDLIENESINYKFYSYCDNVRATLVDDCFYILANNFFGVKKLVTP